MWRGNDVVEFQFGIPATLSSPTVFLVHEDCQAQPFVALITTSPTRLGLCRFQLYVKQENLQLPGDITDFKHL